MVDFKEVFCSVLYSTASFLQVPFTFCKDICQEKGLFVFFFFGLAEKFFAGAQKCDLR